MIARRLAFSLIELLIVIAIITILAAILFPVFGRVRENARQATCMTNMHEIWVGARLFHEDHNKWPCLLLGYAERAPDHKPWQPQDTAHPVAPAYQIQHHFLYPNYVKNIETFHCPDNPVKDQTQATIADYPPSSPMSQVLSGVLGGHT